MPPGGRKPVPQCAEFCSPEAAPGRKNQPPLSTAHAMRTLTRDTRPPGATGASRRRARAVRRAAAASSDRPSITLLDYGAGNVRSLRNAVKALGYELKEVRERIGGGGEGEREGNETKIQQADAPFSTLAPLRNTGRVRRRRCQRGPPPVPRGRRLRAGHGRPGPARPDDRAARLSAGEGKKEKREEERGRETESTTALSHSTHTPFFPPFPHSLAAPFSASVSASRSCSTGRTRMGASPGWA